jgi:hypothetical protein
MSKYDGLLTTSSKKKTPAAEPLKSGVGRPRGKASDPEYRQVTVYIRRDTHSAARKRLMDEEKERSELVEELVSDWLGKKK